jgi:hypothetical protein
MVGRLQDCAQSTPNTNPRFLDERIDCWLQRYAATRCTIKPPLAMKRCTIMPPPISDVSHQLSQIALKLCGRGDLLIAESAPNREQSFYVVEYRIAHTTRSRRRGSSSSHPQLRKAGQSPRAPHLLSPQQYRSFASHAHSAQTLGSTHSISHTWPGPRSASSAESSRAIRDYPCRNYTGQSQSKRRRWAR